MLQGFNHKVQDLFLTSNGRNRLIKLLRWTSVVVFLIGGAAMADDSSVIGLWKIPDEATLVEIGKCNTDKICGWLRNVDDPNELDVKNPDPAKRNRKIEGLLIIIMAPENETNWKGTMYSPGSGDSYTGKISLKDEQHIKLSGCIMGGLLCQSQVWTKQ